MSTNSVRNIFNAKIKELCEKSNDRCCLYDEERYNKIVDEVIEATTLYTTSHKKMTAKQYRRFRRYNVRRINGENRLLEKCRSYGGTVRYYCKNEELFDILEEHHAMLGHKAKGIANELRKKYCNITQQVIDYYLTLCENCSNKTISSKPNVTAVSMSAETPILWKGQVEIIEMNSETSTDYQFILNYIDCMSFFTILRPLKTNSIKEIADHLIDIFCLFRAPYVLQCANGRENAKELVKEIGVIWPELKLVHGEAENNNDDDIREMISCWMTDNDSRDWMKGLRHVQVVKNQKIIIKSMKSPYISMFGVAQKMGLKSSNLGEENYFNIETEEELLQLYIGEREITQEENKNKHVSFENIHIKMEILPDDSQEEISVKEETISCVACSKGTEFDEIFRCLECNRLFHTSCAARVYGTAQEKNVVCVMCNSQNQTNLIVPDNLPSASIREIPIGTEVSVIQLDSGGIPMRISAFVVNYYTDTNLYQLATKEGSFNRLFNSKEFEVTNSNIPIRVTKDTSTRIVSNKKDKKLIDSSLIRCKCTLQCTFKKCRCRSLSMKCSDRCHKKTECMNK